MKSSTVTNSFSQPTPISRHFSLTDTIHRHRKTISTERTSEGTSYRTMRDMTLLLRHIFPPKSKYTVNASLPTASAGRRTGSARLCYTKGAIICYQFLSLLKTQPIMCYLSVTTRDSLLWKYSRLIYLLSADFHTSSRTVFQFLREAKTFRPP